MPELFDSLHARIASTAELRGEIEAIVRRKQRSVRGILVVCENLKEDPVSVMERRLPVTCSVLWRSKYGAMIRLTRTFKERGVKVPLSGKALLIPTTHPKIWIALTVERPEFFSKVLRRSIDRCAPNIFSPRINAKALGSVLLRAEQSPSIQGFEITDVSSRSKMEHKKGKRIRSERIHTGETLQEVLTLLQERGGWLHGAAFDYVVTSEDHKTKCSGRISRESAFAVKGEFNWFYDNVIVNAKDEAVTALKFFADRARSETTNNVPRPMVIEYSEAIFSDKSKNRRLLQSLRRLSKGSVSVLHANPYFRSSIVDFTDGSSYDIWVLSERRITITPQFRATSASMERVIDHILTDFGEGELKDYGEAFNATG